MAALNPDAPAFNPQESNPLISPRSPYHRWNDPYGMLPTFTRSPYHHPLYDPYPISFYYPSSLVYHCFPTVDMQPSYRMYPDCNLDPLLLQNPTPKIPTSFFNQHPSLAHQSPNPQLTSKPLQKKVEEEKDEKEAPVSTPVELAEKTKPGEAIPTVSKCLILKESTRCKIEGDRARNKVWLRKNRSLEYEGWGKKTTLMIKHIPVKYTKEMLLQLLDEHCIAENGKLTSEDSLKKNFMSAYDFLYLPIDFRTKCNKGYAFVNFTNVIGACRLRRVLEGYKWEVLGSKKICHITNARIQVGHLLFEIVGNQGREALKKHFGSSKFFCETEAYLPVFFNTYRNGSCGFDYFTVGIRVPHSDKQQPNRK
ncbi:protein terminal ear1 [Cinnamomum micranthum f. kanehirae]|uniref:Protein terminal ear1 n=1 Tax=Cinnamomum micranthum f. kanehirae TaxID=337451 RepID=A0A443NKY9_9MAGN|nr:protein terminal ear1 [Cinnamomum micranthum f. kanehirae]